MTSRRDTRSGAPVLPALHPYPSTPSTLQGLAPVHIRPFACVCGLAAAHLLLIQLLEGVKDLGLHQGLGEDKGGWGTKGSSEPRMWWKGWAVGTGVAKGTTGMHVGTTSCYGGTRGTRRMGGDSATEDTEDAGAARGSGDAESTTPLPPTVS